VHAPDKVFDLLQGTTPITRLPIKGLYGKLMSFEEYVTLMRLEARSDGHHPALRYLGLYQGSLWA
jgi:hypothetical protein